MPSRVTIRNRVNKILNVSTKGLFNDDAWQAVQDTWKSLRDAGYDVSIMDAKYGHDSTGVPIQKVWLFEVCIDNSKPLQGILTAHGAGSCEDPLDRYDISAYVS